MWKKCCCLCARETYEPPDVQELDYRHSSLTEVPPEIFTYERTLEKLLLGSNQISDLPPNLFYCHELRELDICDNELKEIPAAIESLNRLSKLNVNRNALTEVPESIKNCKNLTYLDLSLNQLCKIPEAICQLVHLEELFLNETALDFLPANFGRLTRLKNLELRDNTIVSLPMSMNRLSQLQRLDIGVNEMEELPTVIGSMTNLVELWADDNAMRQDCNSKVLGNLPKLMCLDMSKNQITSLSEQISKCTNLTDITLSYNDLPEMPSSFTKLENATTVRIDNNRLTRLPDDLGKLKNLQELVLSCNLLKSIPLSIGLLRKLHTLYLDDNRLGELPKEIGSCTSLSVLSVANNSIKEIPSEIGHLSNLKVLILTNNSIRNLPVSILGLTNLGALWLTEGQNKPLVTLNREIDSATGQHVVTCCLLPQLPSPDIAASGDHTEDITPRRSGRKIRFETDVEPPVPEKPAANGGLLRAPTPYPKELRAMAKHASHIRQTKNQNGEAINISDEPMYEGDMNEDSTDFQAKQNFELKTMSERQQQDNPTENNYHHQQQQQQQHHHEQKIQKNNIATGFSSNPQDYLQFPTKSLIEDDPSIPPVITSSTIRNLNYPPQQPLYRPGAPQQQAQTVDDGAASAFSSSFAMGRTPPPYHIAAQRAAFFRSSGGAGTGKINFPSEMKSTMASDAATAAASNHVPNLDTPPISPDLVAGEGANGTSNNANATHLYEPILVTSLPQSSNSSSNRVPSSNINETAHQDQYESANINTVIQYQNQSGLLNQTTTSINNNAMMGGREINDNVHVMMMDPTANNTATTTTAMNSNAIGYSSEIQSDRNGNITSNKSYPQFDDDHHHSNNAPMFSSSTTQEDLSRDETMPPAMPLLMDGNKEHQQHQPQTSNIPTTSQRASNFKSPESKVCRIPSLQSAAAGRRHQPTSHVSNIATPSRIPSADSSSTQPLLSPVSSLVVKEVSNIPLSRSTTTTTTTAHPEFQYAASKTASTSRIPGGLYSSASSEHKSAAPTGVHSSVPKRNAGMSPTGIKYGGGGSSGIPRMDYTNIGSPAHHQDGLKGSSRIPKLEAPRALPEDMSLRSSSSTDEEKRSAYSSSGASEKSFSRGISPKLSRSGAERESDHMLESKIPTTRKPWIFGTHRNARVVSVEHTKVNQFKLGFSITEFTGPTAHPEGKGIYVTAADSEELPIKIGDKILQVDGIDVGDMGVEIVNKILGNCQENIQLLVSRQQ